MILPSRFSLYAIASLVMLAIVQMLLPEGSTNFWLMGLGSVAIVLLFDAFLCLFKPKFTIEREISPSFALGTQQTIHLKLDSQSKSTIKLALFDHVPNTMQVKHLPQHLALHTKEHAKLSYQVTPQKRGLFNFQKVQIRIKSRLGFWWHDFSYTLENEVRVYPNYTQIAHYSLLAAEHQLNQMGVVKKQRRGEGSDFHQLREYREGDSLRQIDWKATARMQKPISREYQDERNQEIMVLLDCGHRMLAKDDELSHFDHILNAILLLSHVALKQGDGVGMGTFSGTPRWLPAQKGQVALQSLLNQVYDLNPSTQAPDYRQAATEFLVRQKRRSLVIVVTNLRDEDLGDLLPAMQSLRKRHLVLLVSMREQTLDNTLDQTIDQFDEALDHAATQRYLESRDTLIKHLTSLGIQALDVPPQALTASLINAYLGIKRSGAL